MNQFQRRDEIIRRASIKEGDMVRPGKRLSVTPDGVVVDDSYQGVTQLLCGPNGFIPAKLAAELGIEGQPVTDEQYKDEAERANVATYAANRAGRIPSLIVNAPAADVAASALAPVGDDTGFVEPAPAPKAAKATDAKAS